MLDNIKFTLVKFKPGYYWSKILHKKVWMDDIAYIVWEDEDLPIKTEIVSFPELIKYIKDHPGDCKAHRNAACRILSERFPLKEQIGIEFWDGCIYCDIDMHNSKIFSILDEEKTNLLYKQLDYALQNIAPNNYFYIEHSSNDNGIHVIFYFDCEKTRYNHDRFCKYIYDIFRYKIDDYIKDFSKAVFDETNGHAVFDPVYERPYQKLFITCKDMIVHNVNGYCDDIEVDFVEKEIKEQEINGTFDVKFITSKKKYDTDYYDRLYVLTALKRFVGDYDKAKMLWYSFCEQISLYKNYTIQKYKNMFEQNWNKIDASTGHMSILKKYGFTINENELHLHLKENEYVGDYVEDIINFCSEGINLLEAGTGGGKTEGWKRLHEKYSQPLEFQNHKPILIIEPMNSIIESKYDIRFTIIKGSSSVNNLDFSTYKCVVTNYNHLVKRNLDGFSLMDNIDIFFNLFELIVVDESHIMIKDAFRSDVLIPFMQTLNKIKHTKVIVQTASPLFENLVLDNKKRIIIHKQESANVKVIYRQVETDKFNITNIICLVDYYIKNGKKVYIYWKDGSLNNMKLLKQIYPETIMIYHKRDSGSMDMSNINTEHNLGDNKLLISSVYFGVGNDLNDEVDDVAVIIIGNNIWQEDIQAKGRWRKAKNIEICIVLLPHDRSIVEASLERPFDFGERLDLVRKRYEYIYYDKFNRDKSVIINGKGFNIKDKEYIDYLAKMQVANEYSSQICVKNENFKKLGWDVRETIKPLQDNGDWMEELKKHRQDINDVRNSYFREFLNGNYDWDNINKDSSLEKCARIIRKLQVDNLIQYCDMDKFVKSKILNYGIFLKYYGKRYYSVLDYAELYSILWTRKKILEANNKDYIFNGIELNKKDYYTAVGYLIWEYYRNKEEKDYNIKSFYLTDFIKNVEAFLNIEERLINRIFVNQAYTEEYNEFIKDFLGSRLDEENITEENLVDRIKKLDYNEIHLNKNILRITDYYKDRKTQGKAGGKVSKRVKHVETGLEFNSMTEAAEHFGKRPESMSRWLKEGKLIKM